MFRPFTLLITTAALGDIAGDPTAFMSYDIWSQDEDGFFSATVSSAVYTEPEQQEVIGLPEGALLVTVTIENDWESTLPIEDLDIYVGESTSEIAGGGLGRAAPAGVRYCSGRVVVEYATRTGAQKYFGPADQS